ncbi:hypothetical protein HYV79_01110 [Candidatus Woesearchaeota archaeon]|nr:hypothetical protein [Candidatus Woesearchaeota archaeon]
MEKHKSNSRTRTHATKYLAVLTAGLLLLLIAGCATPETTVPSTPATPKPVALLVPDCTTKECFVSSANDCKDIDLTLTEDAGVLKYSSSKDCIFTKTLISLNANDTQEMKSLLNGKSLTCRYEKGKFDQRWATSLIFGTEFCEGELKDILVELILFF